MSGVVATVVLQEELQSFLAILGLLFTWELHDLEVRKGCIKPADLLKLVLLFRTVSLVREELPRLYLRLTLRNSERCQACCESQGEVILPSDLRDRSHRRRHGISRGCRCVLLGMYAEWPGVEELSREVTDAGGTLRLKPEALQELWRESETQMTPQKRHRATLFMLGAVCAEATNIKRAVACYRAVIAYAQGRELDYVVPAYLRLSYLLEACGMSREALDIVRAFFKTFKRPKGRYAPTEIHFIEMATRQERLHRLLGISSKPQSSIT